MASLRYQTATHFHLPLTAPRLRTPLQRNTVQTPRFLLPQRHPVAEEDPEAEARAKDAEVLHVVVVAPVELTYRKGDLDLMRKWQNIDAAQAEDEKDSRKTRRAGTRRLQVRRAVTKARYELDSKVKETL